MSESDRIAELFKSGAIKAGTISVMSTQARSKQERKEQFLHNLPTARENVRRHSEQKAHLLQTLAAKGYSDEMVGLLSQTFNTQGTTQQQDATSLEEQNAAIFEPLTRSGQMSLDDWRQSITCFSGCEAILCELQPDFDLGTIFTLSDYRSAAAVAIGNAILDVESKRSKTQINALRKALETVNEGQQEKTEDTLARFFATCDKALKATKKWHISLLDKAVFRADIYLEHRRDYTLRELMAFARTREPQTPRANLPTSLAHSTFIEARSMSHAVSDAQSLRNWGEIEGQNALLHSPRIDGKKSPLETRFEPTPEFWSWWGVNPTKEAVKEALQKLNLETNITFQVTLACILQTEHARQTFTIDEIIKLIGRNTDARRSSEARQALRREIWGNLLAIASMPVIGVRNGVWREPGPQNEKRAIIPKEELISRDPLLVITGTRGTSDAKGPPKEVSITAGEWLMPWVGNREILSDFGDVLKLAQIPRGKPSGAWAACIGLSLQQGWREEATKAQKKLVSRGNDEEPKTTVLKFRPFTRRELLTKMFSCDDENSPDTILGDPEGRRARAQKYWESAIRELKRLGVIGYYREVIKLEDMETNDLNKAWFDQPLDIRPSDAILKDALEIHNDAIEAKNRGQRSGGKVPKKVD